MVIGASTHGLFPFLNSGTSGLGLHAIPVGEVRLEGVQLLVFRLIGQNGCLGHGKRRLTASVAGSAAVA